MAFNYVVTAQKPTGCVASLVGNFMGKDNLDLIVGWVCVGERERKGRECVASSVQTCTRCLCLHAQEIHPH